jgi:hypothetical protein
MIKEVEVLSDKTNSAVIRMPERQFPGLLLQGDTVSSWCEEMREIVGALENGDVAEAIGSALHLSETLSSHLDHYEKVLKANNLKLPYVSAIPIG